MAFLIDPQELKPGLLLFRRADVQHRNWYCRIRVPGSDRYKTVSLRTADVTMAKEAAFDADADLRFRVKHDVPVFNRTFAQIAKMYADHQQARSEAGEITHHRWEVVESIIRAQINRYVGAKQIAHVSHDDFLGYPLWRRQNGLGRGGRPVSDATIRYEMSIFRSVIVFAAGKRFVPESHVYKGKLPLAKLKASVMEIAGGLVPKSGHNLIILFDQLLRARADLGHTDDDAHADHVRDTIRRVQMLDPFADRFRYPTSKSGAPFEGIAVDYDALFQAYWLITTWCEGATLEVEENRRLTL